jgi:hypothetical protein
MVCTTTVVRRYGPVKLVLSDNLHSPPDWRSAEANGSFYASDAAIYRLLDLADGAAAWSRQDDVDFALLADRFSEFNHAERKLAALAMVAHMRHAKRPQSSRTRRVFLQLLRQRPGLLLQAGWSCVPAILFG